MLVAIPFLLNWGVVGWFQVRLRCRCGERGRKTAQAGARPGEDTAHRSSPAPTPTPLELQHNSGSDSESESDFDVDQYNRLFADMYARERMNEVD